MADAGNPHLTAFDPIKHDIGKLKDRELPKSLRARRGAGEGMRGQAAIHLLRDVIHDTKRGIRVTLGDEVVDPVEVGERGRRPYD